MINLSCNQAAINRFILKMWASNFIRSGDEENDYNWKQMTKKQTSDQLVIKKRWLNCENYTAVIN